MIASPPSVRFTSEGPTARRRGGEANRTVSRTINSDLDAQAKRFGMARRKAEQLQSEIHRDLKAASSYIAKHGSFSEMVRQHYRGSDDD